MDRAAGISVGPVIGVMAGWPVTVVIDCVAEASAWIAEGVRVGAAVDMGWPADCGASARSVTSLSDDKCGWLICEGLFVIRLATALRSAISWAIIATASTSAVTANLPSMPRKADGLDPPVS